MYMRVCARVFREGGHRVPTMARWLGKIQPNTVNAKILSSLDWYLCVGLFEYRIYHHAITRSNYCECTEPFCVLRRGASCRPDCWLVG
jgi:hypothetical protein